MKKKKDYFNLIDNYYYTDSILKKQKIKKNRKIKTEKNRNNTNFKKGQKRRSVETWESDGEY